MSLTLSEIATLSGKSTLYKVLKPGKSGVILESLDAAKTKIVANANNRLSILSEISIYTTTKEGTVPLEDVLKKIYKEYKNDLGIEGEGESAELKSFLKSIVPDYDETRVYVSDMKKLVRWYKILVEQAPEIFTTETEGSKSE
jgi:hypothetical protein